MDLHLSGKRVGCRVLGVGCRVLVIRYQVSVSIISYQLLGSMASLILNRFQPGARVSCPAGNRFNGFLRRLFVGCLSCFISWISFSLSLAACLLNNSRHLETVETVPYPPSHHVTRLKPGENEKTDN